MNKIKYIVASLLMILAGIFFFMYQKEIIIFRLQQFVPSDEKKENQIPNIKKIIKLIYWSNDKWNSEKTEILWSNNQSENIHQIVSNWLILLDDEKIMDKKVSLQTTLIAKNNDEVYLSFDRHLFNDESSTNNKLMVIEGLLKTLRENNITMPKINFLVHHQEMMDSHLDFSHAWPLSGFVKN